MIDVATAPSTDSRILCALIGAMSPRTGAALRIIGDSGRLLGAEEDAARLMRPLRRREFAAGRAAARAAMHRVGAVPAAVPMGADRAPVWPAGLSGSISHAGRFALAVVRPARDRALIGLDLAEDAALDEQLWDIVLSDADCVMLADQPPEGWGGTAKLIFSAKEAAYKAQYPHSRQLLDFHAMSVRVDAASGRFAALLEREVPPFRAGFTIAGRFVRCGGYTLTTVDQTF